LGQAEEIREEMTTTLIYRAAVKTNYREYCLGVFLQQPTKNELIESLESNSDYSGQSKKYLESILTHCPTFDPITTPGWAITSQVVVEGHRKADIFIEGVSAFGTAG
jgi:hypothetical protein